MIQEHKKDDLRNLPDCVSEYIKRVVKKMHYRRKVGLEVKTELAANFEDELQECKNNEERNKKARQLIAEFGDVKLLAVLLRRAKKRCRPLWRTVVVRSFQAVGVLIVCFFVYVLWFMSGRPEITTNYIAELNRVVRPAADESLNAAPLYNRAIQLYPELSDDFIRFFIHNSRDELFNKEFEQLAGEMETVLSDKDRRKDIQNDILRILSSFINNDIRELTVEQKEIAKRWVQENNNALELLMEGSRKPYYWQTYGSGPEKTGAMIEIFSPELSFFRRLFFVMQWRIYFSAERNRYADAFEDILTCYRLGRHLRGDKTQIEQLVGIAIEGRTSRIARDILSRYDIDSKILADFQHELEIIYTDAGFRISLKAECMMVYDELQRCFTSGIIGKGHLYPKRISEISSSNSDYEMFENPGGISEIVFDTLGLAPFVFYHPNKEQTIFLVNQYFEYMEQLSPMTAAQLHADRDAIEDKIKRMLEDNYFLHVFAPAFYRVFEVSNRIPAEIGATLSIIALLRYKQDNGQYPDDLNQLVASGYLKQMPIDTFGDKPLVYRRTDNDFILYSFGGNCKDDDGEIFRDRKGKLQLWSDKADAVFWPVYNSREIK